MKKSSNSLKPHPKYGFLQYKPTPTPEEIDEFYSNEFYSGEYKNFNDSSLEVQLNDREFYEGNWENIFQNINEILGNPNNELNLLDVGCGWAQALLYFRDKGINCYGFDPVPEAVKYGLEKGLNIKLAGMESMDVFNGKQFDVVTLINVLEHLADPVKVLEQLKNKVLNQDGILIIDVPNEFNAFQMAGRELHNLDEWWIAPPAHLNYFSKDSLKNLLEGTGYQVKIAESSFPLEMFLLFGDCYVGNGKLGKECHRKRVSFETNMRSLGYGKELNQFYQSLAKLNLGRQITVYASLN